MKKRDILIIAGLLVAATVTARLLPHLPNLTPLSAIGITGGVYLGKRYAILLPLLALLISDIFLGFYSAPVLLSVYGSFVLIGVLGCVASVYRNVFVTVMMGAVAPVVFFLITNAAVWAFSPWYAKNLAGLLYAYELGLPFFRTMFAGDLAYTVMLVTTFECIRLVYQRRVVYGRHGMSAC